MKSLFNIFSRKRSQLECDIDSFFNAVKKQNIEAMDLLLEKYPSAIDWQDGKGRMPLAVAIEEKKLESFQYLLSKKANPNAFILNINKHTDGKGMNAFHIACKHGMLDFVAALLDHSVDRSVKCEVERRDPQYSMLKIYLTDKLTGEELAVQQGHYNVINLIKTYITPGPRNVLAEKPQTGLQL